MGWKTLKETYDIGHIVHIRDGLYCIGSAYVPDIIAIDRYGAIVKGDEPHSNDDLARYLSEFKADPDKLAEAVMALDTFGVTQPVFTFTDAEIREMRCEEMKWPNVTTCGELMYDNMFFETRAEAVAKSISELEIGVKWASESLAEKEKQVTETRERLDRLTKRLAVLKGGDAIRDSN